MNKGDCYLYLTEIEARQLAEICQQYSLYLTHRKQLEGLPFQERKLYEVALMFAERLANLV